MGLRHPAGRAACPTPYRPSESAQDLAAPVTVVRSSRGGAQTRAVVTGSLRPSQPRHQGWSDLSRPADAPALLACCSLALVYGLRVLFRGAAAAGLVCALVAVPSAGVAAGAGSAATGAPEPTPSPVATYAVPPSAPMPTSQARSPDSPDPHPPRGGIGPDGEAVGGSRLLSRSVVVPAHAPPLPAGLTAQGWVLVDLDTGDILAARDPHGRYQPASILKALTSITLLPLLPGNRVVTVSAAAAHAEGSAAGLVTNGTYTVDQLFAGLLLVSGNDTAQALADAAGGYQKTVALMNQKALSLGAYDTYVQTPSGLDGWQQLTSAYDMAIFLRAAVDDPRFVAYDRQAKATLPRQAVDGYGPVTLINQNEQFLTTVPGALVAKTGYTDAAQHTYLGAVARHGRRLGVVFMRAQRWPTDQWQQAVDLVNWGFALPAGTAPVGHLAAPVVSATSPASTGRNEARAGSVALARFTQDDLRWAGWLLIALALAAGLALWPATRRRRAGSARRAGSR